MPVPTYSAHMIVHPGLSRAVDQFLAAERAVMEENIAELTAHGPFRKSDGGNDGL
jgi:predicted N-acyltransferase